MNNLDNYLNKWKDRYVGHTGTIIISDNILGHRYAIGTKVVIKSAEYNETHGAILITKSLSESEDISFMILQSDIELDPVPEEKLPIWVNTDIFSIHVPHEYLRTLLFNHLVDNGFKSPSKISVKYSSALSCILIDVSMGTVYYSSTPGSHLPIDYITAYDLRPYNNKEVYIGAHRCDFNFNERSINVDGYIMPFELIKELYNISISRDNNEQGVYDSSQHFSSTNPPYARENIVR